MLSNRQEARRDEDFPVQRKRLAMQAQRSLKGRAELFPVRVTQ